MQLIPSGTPPLLRKIALVTMILFIIVGLGFTLQLVRVSFFSFLLNFIYFFLLGAASAFAILMSWHWMSMLAQKHLRVKLDTIYQSQGYCSELAETAFAVPTPTDKDKLLHVFLLVMAEDYEHAETMLLRINRKQLTGREAAMYDTCRLRMLVMSGEFDTVQRMLLQEQDAINRAYEMKPDLFEQYLPYADDALVFYMLAAAASLQNREPERAAEYRRHAEFQITNRSETEMGYYPLIFDLNMYYASEKYEEAHQLENTLRGEIECSTMMRGIKQELLRLIEQARIYGNLARYIAPDVTRRRLPDAALQNADISAVLSEEGELYL